MKKLLIIVAILIIAGGAIWFAAPDSSNDAAPNKQATQSEPNAAQTAVSAVNNGTAYIYDVRTPEEFAAKNVQGAINFDVEKMISGNLPDVPKDSQIYVYCRSGNRSNQAKEILSSNGYTNVTDLGGLDDLSAAGVL